MLKRKSLVWLLVALLLLVSIFYYADFLKDDRRQAIFSKPQRYTAEQLEETWNALCAAVDFSVK